MRARHVQWLQPMDPKDLMPALTAFEAAMQLASILVYIAVGAAALGHAPRDERTRVFLLLAIMNAVVTGIPVVFWWLGITDAMAGGRAPLALMMAGLTLATLALFHLSQVFPRRRPWIRTSGPQLPIAYALAPIIAALLVRTAPLKEQQASGAFIALAIAFGFPLIVLNGLVLPIATIVGFIRSFRESPLRGGLPDARPSLAGFLMSMLVGTAVAVLAVGPLEALAPESPATLLAGLTVWGLGLLMPLAYAAGVWRYRVLDIPLEGSVVVEPD
jgi:hypothetical protein